ncbi:Ig-like domain repeat protein [Rhizobacter sp. J219]|uniref:Ig-like domain repeat protein n=1 Tax=Rhizobacter sp. J219 TaxID=2898430 RepID=UPI00215150F9|nr:Ig-like domain repeat protein [Rhizobacter sp. J219]MCR5881398.1 Ig-like domain repeat protein [Rhizobacter sp. J219]
MNSMMQSAPVWRFVQTCAVLASARLALGRAKRSLAVLGLWFIAGTALAQTATTTTLTANPSSVYAGQTFTITARVTGSSPTGSVTVYDGAQALFYFNLSGGTASTSYSFTATGDHSLTARYAGNSTNAASTSAPVILNVYTRAPTTTTVTASPTAAYIGQTVSFSATVTGATTPTGVVRFNNNGSYVAQGTLNGSGVATGTWVINSTSPTMSLSASYVGDATYAPSTSSAIAGTVSPAPVSTQLTCPTPSPVATAVACTVTATSPSIYASVSSATITENGATVGTGTLSYVASNPTTFRGTITLPATAAPATVAGSHSLVAQTVANSQTQASTSPATTLVIAPRSTTTTLSSTPSTAGATQIVTLTANVSNGLAPTGSVTFRDGATPLGTVPLNGTQASATTSFTTTGAHSLTAVYNGDTNNTSSTSAAVNQTITATAPTSTALTVSPGSVTAGSTAALAATITGSSPSGTVVFLDGTTVLGQSAVSGGQATLSVPFGSTGAHSLTAQYWGDTANGSSTSPAAVLTVTQRPTTTTLTSTLTRAHQSQPVPLTAAIDGANPSGTVTFREGSTTLGTANVVNGAASFSPTFTVIGAHTITAAYAGDANNGASNAGTVTVQVEPGPVPPTSTTPVVNYEYDAKGNPTKAVQAPGVSGFNFETRASYDSLSRVKDTTNPKNGITRFEYDGGDRLNKVTDPRLLVTQYPRNGLGDATSLISPDTGTATHTYDEAGNLKTRTDSRSVLTTYSYDEANRLTQAAHTKTGMNSQTFGWTYDQTGAGFSHGIGRLTSTTHPAGSTQYAYDAQGRLTTDIQRVDAAAGANATQIVNTVGYEYDAAGNLTRITYPSGAQVSFGHTDGQVSSVSLARNAGSTAATLVSGIEFEPFGAIKRWQWHLAGGSTQVSERRYDLSARLTRYRLGNVLRDLTYDAADRITSYSHYDATTGAAQTSLNQSFGYDENGRLTTITTATASWSIGYDANGNRTSVTLNGTPSTYTTSTTSNRLNSITNPARSFGYDNAGNTTSDTAGYTSTYDAAGRLSTLTKAGVTTTYSYNGLGQRVRKFGSTGASSTTVFVYDQQGQLLGEYSNTGAALREYVWLGSTPIAMFVPNGTNDPTVYYFHTDHLDTPRIATDTANNVRWRWMAEPFGTTAPEDNLSNLGSLTQNLRFPGQYADAESGLYYNYFRDYDSTTGRYAQSDPIGLAGGINTFSYVGGNPIALSDPLGLKPPPSVLSRILPTAGAVALADGPEPGPADAVAVALLAAAVIYDACTVDNDERCREKLAEIHAAMQVINGRIGDLLLDKCDMYRLAFWVPNPALAAGCSGTSWVGHLKAVDGWQQRLRKLIREAIALKCKIPPDAWAIATRPIPRAPRGSNGNP